MTVGLGSVIGGARQAGSLAVATATALDEGIALAAVSSQVRRGTTSGNVAGRSFKVVDDPDLAKALAGSNPRVKGVFSNLSALEQGKEFAYAPGSAFAGLRDVAGSARVLGLSSSHADLRFTARLGPLKPSMDVSVRQLTDRHVQLQLQGHVRSQPLIAEIVTARRGLVEIRPYGATSTIALRDARAAAAEITWELGGSHNRLLIRP